MNSYYTYLVKLHNDTVETAGNGTTDERVFGFVQVNSHIIWKEGYPCCLRCKYFHGEHTAILLAAYNEYNLAVSGMIIYFLRKYLNKAIPLMFENDLQDKGVSEAMKYKTVCIKTEK